MFTKSGFSARIVSAHRPQVPILALTDEPRTYSQLALVWGVIPQLVPHCETYEAMVARARDVVLVARAREGGRSRARHGRRSVRRARNDERAPGRARVKLTFLGTGTSFGVPQIGCTARVAGPPIRAIAARASAPSSKRSAARGC